MRTQAVCDVGGRSALGVTLAHDDLGSSVDSAGAGQPRARARLPSGRCAPRPRAALAASVRRGAHVPGCPARSVSGASARSPGCGGTGGRRADGVAPESTATPGSRSGRARDRRCRVLVRHDGSRPDADGARRRCCPAAVGHERHGRPLRRGAGTSTSDQRCCGGGSGAGTRGQSSRPVSCPEAEAGPEDENPGVDQRSGRLRTRPHVDLELEQRRPRVHLPDDAERARRAANPDPEAADRASTVIPISRGEVSVDGAPAPRSPEWKAHRRFHLRGEPGSCRARQSLVAIFQVGERLT
jgi:hypothetical protein